MKIISSQYGHVNKDGKVKKIARHTIKMSKKEWTSIGKKAGWMDEEVVKVVKKDIKYQAAPYGYITTIPKGVAVHPATNLPEGGYWAEEWDGMDEKARSWFDNYGFHLLESDVEEFDDTYHSEPSHQDILDRKSDERDEAEYYRTRWKEEE